MKIIVLVITILAWVGQFLISGKTARLVQFCVFLPVGLLLVVFGSFDFWWDKSMRPTGASPFLLVCGVLILFSQARAIFIALSES